MARAKIIRHDGHQAVLLPEEFRFDVDEVDIHMDGDRLILKAPRKPKRWAREELDAFWARIDAIRGDDELAYPEQPVLRDTDFDV